MKVMLVGVVRKLFEAIDAVTVAVLGPPAHVLEQRARLEEEAFKRDTPERADFSRG